MDRMRVRPRSGLRVYDPKTRSPLPESGAEVPRNSFWLRRLRDRDVELVESRRTRRARAEKE